MSIFYNVRIEGGLITEDRERSNNNNTRTRNGRTLAEFSSERTSNIVDNQNDYEVGVVRFKIPSSTLPKYILDYTRGSGYKVGFNFRQSARNLGQTGTGYKPNEDDRGQFYGSMVNMNGGDNYITRYFTPAIVNADWNNALYAFPDPATLDPLPVENNVIEIQSDEELVPIMDSAFQNAFLQQQVEFCRSNTYSIGGSPYKFTNQTAQSLTRWGTGNNSYTLNLPIALQSYDLNVNAFFLSLQNIRSSGSLNDLRISIGISGTGANAFEFTLLQGFGSQGLSQMNNQLILSNIFTEDFESLKYKKSFTGDLQGKPARNYLARPTLSDLSVFNDNKTMRILANSPFFMRFTNLGNDTITLPANSIKVLLCANAVSDSPPATASNLSTIASPYALEPTPTLIYDNTNGFNETTGKFKIKMNTSFLKPSPPDTTISGTLRNTNGNKICFNNNLNSLFNFNTKDCEESFSVNIGGTGMATEDNGIDLESKFLFIPMGTGTEINLDGQKKDIEISELNPSNYKRQIVSTLIIATNSISVSGEILQGQNESRKMLTDFEPDLDQTPTTFQYQPSGNIRYYPLKATLPLRKVGLKILWEDIYGGVNDFYIQNGEEITMKLEFRPKNYIQNYPMNTR
tara:strand:+ start:12858 stop:14744 length:1887 start_codon:yes stop_codon:yes gene_type:complete